MHEICVWKLLSTRSYIYTLDPMVHSLDLVVILDETLPYEAIEFGQSLLLGYGYATHC